MYFLNQFIQSETPNKKRPHTDEDSQDEENEENLTSNDLLNKYCEIESEDDPDYEVDDEESESVDETSDEESSTEDAIVENKKMSENDQNNQNTQNKPNDQKKQNGDYNQVSESQGELIILC